MQEYINQLKEVGDPIEHEAVKSGLIAKFPRYAEFWSKYVFPNQHSDQQAMLHRLDDDLPPELGLVFDTHYNVLFRANYAYAQLREPLPTATIDISGPLFHLGGVIDLVKQVFIRADNLPNTPSQSELENRRNETFDKLTKGQVEVAAFVTCSAAIRSYRNELTHGRTPLRFYRANTDRWLIPTREYFESIMAEAYSRQLRQAGNPENYAPATEVIMGLADELLDSINRLWTRLLQMMVFKSTTAALAKWLEKEVLECEATEEQRVDFGPVTYPQNDGAATYGGGTIEYRGPWPQPPS